MRLLFDTHLVLWTLEGSRKLPAAARSLLEDEEHDHYVSAASVWEIAIKTRLGKLSLSRPVSALEGAIKQSGFNELRITIAHAARVAEEHSGVRDPFDRLLLAQCEMASLRLVSADRALADSAWVLPV
jgi:PIN domain nuclease of toxin-antitoxin system